MASFRCVLRGQAGKGILLCGSVLSVDSEGACRTDDPAQLRWLRSQSSFWVEQDAPAAEPQDEEAKTAPAKARKGKRR